MRHCTSAVPTPTHLPPHTQTLVAETVIVTVYRLPYIHVLTIYNGQPLLFNDFYLHWRLICDGALLHLLEPQCIELRARATQKALPASSTKREPSEFEVVEVVRAKRPSQCTACGEIGHIKTLRVCPQCY